jgi:hypothetical protein
MHARTSSTRTCATALTVACSALALLGAAASADAASQRPTDRPDGGCAQHPERPACAPATTQEPAAQEPAVAAASPDQPAAQDAGATAASEPAPTQPQPQPDAIDDPPTIITGTSDAPPTDECRNLAGAQADVPEGMYLDAYGNCLEPANMASGDGVDDGVEEGGGPAGGGTGASGSAGGAPPHVGGGVAGSSGGGATAQGSGSSAGDATGGGATAVAGAAAVPEVDPDVAGTALDASGSGGLPFTGMSLLALAAIGALSVLVGSVLRSVRRTRRSPA